MKALQNKVLFYLRTEPATRSSDKLLLWRVAFRDKVEISFQDFMNAPAFESVTRCRRKCQEEYPELKATDKVQAQRDLNAIKTQAWSLQGKQQGWWK